MAYAGIIYELHSQEISGGHLLFLTCEFFEIHTRNKMSYDEKNYNVSITKHKAVFCVN